MSLHLPFRQILTILLQTCRCVVSGSQTTNCPENSVLEQLDFCRFGRNGLAAVADASMGVGLGVSIKIDDFAGGIPPSSEYGTLECRSSAKSEHRNRKSERQEAFFLLHLKNKRYTSCVLCNALRQYISP